LLLEYAIKKVNEKYEGQELNWVYQYQIYAHDVNVLRGKYRNFTRC
jgi:hypothetical protein